MSWARSDSLHDSTTHVLSHYHTQPPPHSKGAFITGASFSSWFPESCRMFSSSERSCGHDLLQKQSAPLLYRPALSQGCVPPPNSVHLISRKTMTCPGEGGKISLSPPQLHPPNHWIWGQSSRLWKEEWYVSKFHIDYCLTRMPDKGKTMAARWGLGGEIS